MSRFLHVVYHLLSVVAGLSVMVSKVVPEKWKPLAMAVIAICQAIVALWNHPKE
jgi:uncharacterized protein YjeT (DUF2065 family)